ncbi:protogenin-like isoform X2 [Leucoraja erinacea]|uniref:protogenin-like isoform X2 n=1 Tax=Leucoraja erinaceus TaxID=7782 RepID=UPI002456F784|nr:protogenin-like isoform X2 [Leucoraja erinacea]
MEISKRRTCVGTVVIALLLPISGIWCFTELFFMREPHDITALRKDPVVLDCQAHGELPITIVWLKNGQRLADTERTYILSNGSLYITEVEHRRGDRSDEGYYECLAQNKYGAILSQKSHLTVASMSPFEVQPVPTVVREGEVARFICKIHANPPPIITWEFNRTTLPLATDRITVLPTGVLQIYGVDKQHTGQYRCVATNIANRRRSAEAILTVIPAWEPKTLQKPVIIAGPQNITVPVHQTAMLECVAIGSPKPLVSWSRFDHRSIDVFNTRVLGNGNLMISDVKVQHAGIYVCRATTPGTRNYTVATAMLTVLAPPSFVEWPESLTRPRAGTARFMCQAEGIPTPKISWLKNGQRIHSNGRIKVQYSSKLVINQIIPEDDAIYQCVAENEQGSVLSVARLIVIMSEDRPSAPRNIQAETVSSSGILLSWQRPMYNSDKVIAYSVHYMKAEGLNNEEYQVVIGNDTTRYIIDDLEPASNYTFYIVAYMPMGASRMSEHVTQHTLEDVPLRVPEISLTSRSPTDILISWLPIPAKFRRGRIIAYRIHYRKSTERAVHLVELPGAISDHLLEDVEPDSTYLVRISAATKIGWGESSIWTSHRTPKATSVKVPLAPELRLEPFNCTTITVKWKQAEENDVQIQGYRLFYREESQQETGPITLGMQNSHYTISGLDPRRKYHIRLLAYNSMGEGYQADQTVSTPGCVSVRDRMVPPPPPPHHLYAKANSSSSISLQWGKPAFTAAPVINYTVRCNPVGLQNASLVMYLQTSETHMLVIGLQPFTKYEFAVRLHADQLSSPWSPVVYQLTLPEAPTNPPSGVKATLIEEGTALISWKPPENTNTAVTQYTILYASRKAWIGGEWQVLHREGSITMTLLENLDPGNVYLIQISATNEVGEGPFSNIVELVIPATETVYFSQGPKWSDSLSSADAKGNSDVFYHLDQKSMTGIIVGVCIALTCIIICILILLYRSKARKSSAVKAEQQGNVQLAHVTSPLVNGNHLAKSKDEQWENMETLMPMMPENAFLDTKGGSDLIVSNSGHRKEKSKKCFLFGRKKRPTNTFKEEQPVRRNGFGVSPYQLTELSREESGGSVLIPPTSLPAVFTAMGDTEYSHNSDGSHETGDSGRYSHDSREEMEMLHLSSVTCDPPAFLGSSVQGDTASIPVQPTSGEDQRVLVVSHSTTSDLLALPRPSHMSSKPTSENTSNQFPI